MAFNQWLDHFEEHSTRFNENVFPFQFQRKGIWFSEAFSVCAFSSIFNIDCLLESGIRHGRSTEMFARYGLNVFSMDKRKYKSMSRFDNYPNVQIKIGNSVRMFPSLARKMAQQRLGVFIDGPKGKPAISLAKKMLTNDNVKFVGIHDQKTTKKHLMSKYFKNVIYTDEPCFRDRFGHLDSIILSETNWDGAPPDPAGPTIGFVVKNL